MSRIEAPQNRRSRRTRAAILDAAWSLIEERGPEHTTIEDIADEAGIQRRSVYLHFASRADLLTALLAHMDAALDVASSTRSVRDAPDAVTALDEWAGHLARYHPRILPVARAVDRARRTDPDAAALWDRAMRGWYAACRDLAARLADEGRLATPWTVDSASDLLWALMSVDLLEDLTHDRGWSQAQYRERLATLLRRTLVGGK